MFVGRPPGNYDRLLDFSRAVTGNLFFVPSATFLDDVSDEPPANAALANKAQATDETSQSAPSNNKDGSLGIGSLKGEIGHE